MGEYETGRRDKFREMANAALIDAVHALNHAADMLRAGGVHTPVNLPAFKDLDLAEACYSLANAVVGIWEERGEL